MALTQVLLLAVTRMLSGFCIAGLTTERHPASHLRWVRPVKEHGTLLLGDLTDASGRVIQCNDVVELDLQAPRPQPPHVEDWLTDLIYHRPRVLRCLEGERRARFLASHLDLAPLDVLEHDTRSLCLVRPDRVTATFRRDPYSLKERFLLGLTLDGVPLRRLDVGQGLPVTDLKWRALGRAWLQEDGAHELILEQDALLDRLGAQELYLSIGLSREYQRQTWPLVIGVHPVPDYYMEIDYRNP